MQNNRVRLAMRIPGHQTIIREFDNWKEAEKFCIDRNYLPFDHGKDGTWESYMYWDTQTMKRDFNLIAKWQEIKSFESEPEEVELW